MRLRILSHCTYLIKSANTSITPHPRFVNVDFISAKHEHEQWVGTHPVQFRNFDKNLYFITLFSSHQ